MDNSSPVRKYYYLLEIGIYKRGNQVPKPNDDPMNRNDNNDNNDISNLNNLKCARLVRDIELIRYIDIGKKNTNLLNQAKLKDMKIAGLKRKLKRKRNQLFAQRQTLLKLTKAKAKYEEDAKQAVMKQAPTKTKSFWRTLLDIIIPINWK